MKVLSFKSMNKRIFENIQASKEECKNQWADGMNFFIVHGLQIEDKIFLKNKSWDEKTKNWIKNQRDRKTLVIIGLESKPQTFADDEAAVFGIMNDSSGCNHFYFVEGWSQQIEINGIKHARFD